MTQTAAAGDPQAGDPGTQSTSPQAGTTTTPEPQAGDDNTTISLDEAKKLRSEANALRKREKDALAQLKAYQDKEQAAKDAQLPEIEQLKKQVSDAESVHTGLVERIVRYEVERSAGKLGIIDPDAAAQLINWNALEFDDDGMPTNAETLLKDLLKTKSYLAPKGTASAGGATNPSRGASSSQISEQFVNDLLAGRLPQGTYEGLSPGQRAEVQNVLDKRHRF